MIFRWVEFIREFKQEGINLNYVNAKLHELEDLFDDVEHDFYFNVSNNLIRIEFGNISTDVHHGFNIVIEELNNLQNVTMTKDSGEKLDLESVEEALDIIEKDIYNYLGISESRIHSKYENATGIGTISPQPYRKVEDSIVDNGIQTDINKVLKLNKAVKKKKK